MSASAAALASSDLRSARAGKIRMSLLSSGCRRTGLASARAHVPKNGRAQLDQRPAEYGTSTSCVEMASWSLARTLPSFRVMPAIASRFGGGRPVELRERDAEVLDTPPTVQCEAE